MGKKGKDYGTGIPRHEMESFARLLLPTMQAFFESEEGKRKFEQWKRQQAAGKEGRRDGQEDTP